MTVNSVLFKQHQLNLIITSVIYYMPRDTTESDYETADMLLDNKCIYCIFKNLKLPREKTR